MTPTADGGRQGPAFSGYRPHFAIREDYLTSGQIELIDCDELGPGETATARITFLSPSAYPRTLWVGRVLRAQEGRRVVATAEILKVFNPVLHVEGPMFEVLLGGEIIGRSALENRDPSMGVASGKFTPTFAFSKVADVFALFAEAQGDTASSVDEPKLHEYYAARDKLDLRLRSPEGVTIETETIHIADFHVELGPDACELQVHPASPDFFLDNG